MSLSQVLVTLVLLTLVLCTFAAVKNGDTFDFIVVGSGPGGGPLAARLASERFRVLLVEAGEDYIDDTVRIPYLFSFAADNKEIAWDFFVKHWSNETQQARDSKYYPEKGGVLYPRASGVGGCGLHHVLNLLYPANLDFERIQNMFGDKSWSPENMRKIFERIENNRYASLPTTDAEHQTSRYGYEGWMTTEMVDYDQLESLVDDERISLLQNFATTHGGYDELGDFNRWENNGKAGRANAVQASRNGQRFGLYERIKKVQRDFPGYLTIETNALVSRVLFDGTTATGVEFYRGRALYEAHRDFNPNQKFDKLRVYADHEVIVSGGTFNSPQILKLSGVGPKEELEKLDIPVIVNLPGVGTNMQDRYEVGLNYQMKEPWGAYTQCNFAVNNTDVCYNQWKQDGSGLYGTNSILFWSAYKSTVSDAPDLCLFAAMGYFLGYSLRVVDEALKNGFQSEAFLVLKAFTENSAGTVRLRSKDPRRTPEIEFHYFEEGNDREGNDLQAVVEGIKELRRINSNPDFTDLIVEETGTFVNAQTDDEIRQKIRDEAWGHHACCTNKIGARSDPMAVVDGDFKVYGTKNLRVVDNSVFPRIPGYFPLGAIYMISEKAADVIIRDAVARSAATCNVGSSQSTNTSSADSLSFFMFLALTALVFTL